MSISHDDVRFLLAVGAKPTSEEGKKKLEEHYRTCASCAQPGAFNDLLDIVIDNTEEVKAKLEEIFGPVEFTK